MPSLQKPSPSNLVKVLLVGDSGSGKTGSLISLVKAGYQLRILDMDNKIETGILPRLVAKQCPDKFDAIQFESLRDKKKASPMGPIVDGQPKAFAAALRMLDKWADESVPGTWGPSHILVIDSLTFLSDAAFEWARGMDPACKDPRQWYGTAQKVIEQVLAKLTASDFATNVIVISHVSWTERQGDGVTKGYPSAVGTALGPKIPAYFDNMVMAQVTGSGQNVRREIRLAATATIDLKNPAGIAEQALPVETGMATFFERMKA